MLRIRGNNTPKTFRLFILPELEAADVQQVSIETAQSQLDCKVLAALPSKTILLGVLDLADMNVEMRRERIATIEAAELGN